MSIKIRTRRTRYPLDNGVLMTPKECLEAGVRV